MYVDILHPKTYVKPTLLKVGLVDELDGTALTKDLGSFGLG